MAKDKRIAKLEQLVQKGDFDQAGLLAAEIINDYRFNPPDGVIAHLETCAVHSDSSALSLGMLYAMGEIGESARGATEALLERASRSPDEYISGQGHYVLARLLMDQSKSRKALSHLKAAHDKGIGQASFELSQIHMEGKGVPQDPQEGLLYLASAVEQDFTPAKTILAKLMLAGAVEGDFDPVDLLAEAAEEGDLEAEELLEKMEEEDEEKFPEILPYEVVPNDTKRPRQVRDALMEEFGMPRSIAQRLTAAWNGYPTWFGLQRDAADKSTPKGVADEDCKPEELNERRSIQAGILRNFGIEDERVAETAVRLLAPTGRTGKPSLHKLRNELESHLFTLLKRETDAQLAEMMEQLGLPGDVKALKEAMRTFWPITPRPWLLLMETAFGWKFRKKNLKAKKEGAKIAEAPASDGRVFEVHMSSIGYQPGDFGDELAVRTMENIQKKTSNAILIFNKPTAYLDKRGPDKPGLLYGGKMLDGGRWWDFVLRPDGGIEDALAQRGKLEGVPTPEFRKEYSFIGAFQACWDLGALSRGLEPREGAVEMVVASSGWCAPVLGETAEMLRMLISGNERS